MLRIALCGYDIEHEHEMPEGWQVLEWDAGEGFAAQGKERTNNGRRERVWFSPHCLKGEQTELFKDW